MIVEDEHDVRTLIRVMVRRDGRVDVVGETATGEEAVELARSLQPTVVILDFSLEGDLTGLEAAPLIKEAAPNTSILLFTAYDMSSEASEEPAVAAYLRKDRISELTATVERLAG